MRAGDRVAQSIADNPGRCPHDRGGAQRLAAGNLAQVHSVTRYEPDPIRIDNADDCNRNPEYSRRQSRNAIECLVRRGIQNLIASDGAKAVSLVTLAHVAGKLMSRMHRKVSRKK